MEIQTNSANQEALARAPGGPYGLSLWLFGHMRAEDAAGRSILPRSRKTKALLAILALARSQPVSRGQLTTLLWSQRGKDQARASLRQAVHELREALSSLEGCPIQADRDHLILRNTNLWVDALAFTEATSAQPELLSLFRSRLFEDLQGIDPALDPWLAGERRRLTQIARTIAEGILAERRDPTGILAAAEQILAIDRSHEGAWRALIATYAECDDRCAALGAYERCRVALAEAVGALPSPPTEELVARIRQPDATASRTTNPPIRAVALSPSGRRDDVRGTGASVRVGIMPLRSLETQPDSGLALGLTAEVVAALARFRWISCFAGTSLFLAADELRQDWPGQQRTELDFLLEGTVQRSRNWVRIIAHLADVRVGGEVVWTRRFDREVTDILTLQEEIAAEIVAQIDPEMMLREGERTKICRDNNADDLVLSAIPAIYRLTQNGFQSAGDMLKAALALDPRNASAHAWSAYWHLLLVGQGWASDSAAAIRRAGDLAERAVALDPADARALTLAGHVSGFLGRHAEEARTLHDRAIALNPNLAVAWCFSGLTHSYLGDHKEAVRRIDHAHDLSPHDPHGFFFDTALIMPHLLQGNYERAVALGRRAIKRNPGFSSSYKGHLAALGHLGALEEATAVRTRLLVLEPRFCIDDATARSPIGRLEDLQRYIEGLRRAGLS
jgi:DNA-binding SARP family transcriptional activator